MGDSPQGSDKHNPRIDEVVERDPGDEEEVPFPQLWEAPGHDGIVGPDESDPDRTDLRSEIGQVVSLTKFPTTARDLIARAQQQPDPSEEVLAELRRLDPDQRFDNTAELWAALGLGSDRRF